MTEESIMGFIRTKIVNRGITITSIANKMNLSRTATRGFLKGVSHTKLDYVIEVLDFLGYELVIRSKSNED